MVEASCLSILIREVERDNLERGIGCSEGKSRR